MAETKIEPRLLAEIDRLKTEHEASTIPVVIQLTLDELPDTSTTYTALAERLAVRKEVVLECLRRVGFAGALQENVLAGSLAGELSPNQIIAVAQLEQVKRIVFNRLDEVTCSPDSATLS